MSAYIVDKQSIDRIVALILSTCDHYSSNPATLRFLIQERIDLLTPDTPEGVDRRWGGWHLFSQSADAPMPQPGDRGFDLQPVADTIGRWLWRMNLAAVKERYPDDVDGQRPGPVGFRDEDTLNYVWTDPNLPSAIEYREAFIVDEIGSLLYQSAEGHVHGSDLYRGLRNVQGMLALECLKEQQRRAEVAHTGGVYDCGNID